MSEIELDVCQAGETVYLILGPVGGEAPDPGDGPSWLILNDSLHIQVTRHAGPQSRPVILRLPLDDLPCSPEGAARITSATLTTRSGRRQLSPVRRRLGPEDMVQGHVASVSNGALIGWVTDKTAPEREVPVEVAFPDRTLLGLSAGTWHRDAARAFSVPLPADLPQSVPMPVTVRATPDGAPFARAPFYLTRTAAGWLLASPIRRQGMALEGEFLLASAAMRPVSVTLGTADNRTVHGECSLETDIRFGARPCGFRFEGLSDSDLEGARLTVAHQALGGDGMEFDLPAFGPLQKALR